MLRGSPYICSCRICVAGSSPAIRSRGVWFLRFNENPPNDTETGKFLRYQIMQVVLHKSKNVQSIRLYAAPSPYPPITPDRVRASMIDIRKKRNEACTTVSFQEWSLTEYADGRERPANIAV